ncbi:hypothetical protein [Jeotgalibacillus soli]|uniref:Sporulation protein n=1 Tax=Jeotgalibacillus soli TaxID=889306 RepID=A0A0C2RVD2_9BACL|nr:hypothetical protein [Jeotgalibacillus soli]KIL45714.1 hypothetical protein KP78_20630 [Jeotgalibacillus soli]
MKQTKWVAVLMVFLLSGCAMFEEVGPAELAIDEDKREIITAINQKLKETEELYDTIVIAADDQILVSYKVKHMNRFKMKGIEKKLNKWFEKKYPDEQIDVSSDYKIFLESYNLIQNWTEDKLTKKEAKKKFDKIIKLKNEMT